MAFYDDFERRRKEILGGKTSNPTHTSSSSASNELQVFEQRRKQVLTAPIAKPSQIAAQEIKTQKTGQQPSFWEKVAKPVGEFVSKIGEKYKEASVATSHFLFGNREEITKLNKDLERILPLIEKQKQNEDINSVKKAFDLQQEYPALKAKLSLTPNDPAAQDAVRKNSLKFQLADTYNKKNKDAQFSYEFDTGKINSKLYRNIAPKAGSVDEVIAAANALQKKDLNVAPLSDTEKKLLSKYDNNELKYLGNKSRDYVVGALTPYYDEKPRIAQLDVDASKSNDSAQFVEKVLPTAGELAIGDKIGKAGETYDKFAQNFFSGMTGGFLEPQYQLDNSTSEKVAAGIGQVTGSVAGIFALSGVFGAIAKGETVVSGIASKFPRVAKYALPLIKNIAVFDAYGQLNPDVKNRFQQLQKDTLLAVPFTALGYINKAILSIPASFGLGYTLAKIDGADDKDAMIQGAILSVFDGLSRGAAKATGFMSGRATERIGRVEAINVINEFGGSKLKPNASIEEISAAYRQAAKSTHPDVGGDQVNFKKVSAAWDFLSGKGVDLDAFRQANGQKSPTAPPKGSIESIIERKGGWVPGMRKQFDEALMSKDSALVKKLLPDVPKDYATRFSTEINSVLAKAPTASIVAGDPPQMAKAAAYVSAADFANEIYSAKPTNQIGVVDPKSIKIRDSVGKGTPEYNALKADIEKNGIQDPVRVTVEGDQIVTTDGSQRTAIAQELGQGVPIIVNRGEIPGLKTIEQVYSETAKTTPAQAPATAQAPSQTPALATPDPIAAASEAKSDFPVVLSDFWKEKTPTAFTDERLKLAETSKKEVISLVNEAVAAGVDPELIVNSSKYTATKLALEDIREAIQDQKILNNEVDSPDYYISKNTENGREFVKVDDAKRVEIVKNMDTFLHKGDGEWIVSEGKSGHKIASGDTRAAAVESANNIIEENKDAIKKTLRNATKAVGISPRYTAAKSPEKPVEKTPKKPERGTITKLEKELDGLIGYTASGGNWKIEYHMRNAFIDEALENAPKNIQKRVAEILKELDMTREINAKAKAPVYGDAPAPLAVNNKATDYIEDHLKNIGAKQDTGEVFVKRLGKEVKELTRFSGGSVRDVYDIGKYVVKVANSPRGLEQNDMEGDSFLEEIVPRVVEQGKDYVIVEKAEKNLGVIKKFLAPLQKFSVDDYTRKTSELQETFDEMGLGDVLNYDILWNDFIAARNWGIKDGKPILTDAGALNKNITATSTISEFVMRDWQEVLRERREFLSKYRSTGKYPAEVYKAYNSYLGVRETAQEIDKLSIEKLRDYASPGLKGGKEEFDKLTGYKIKAPSGFADNSPYADLENRTKLAEEKLKNPKIIEMPELVKLAKELSGEIPAVAKKLRGARGRFSVPKGVIALDASIFENPVDAAKTLAHEIGHLVDFLPDRTMARGNLVGRIASLNQFMRDSFTNPEVEAKITSLITERKPLQEQRKGLEKKDGKVIDKAKDLEFLQKIRTINKAIKGLRKEEFNNKTVLAELKKVTQIWKPFDELAVDESYTDYRYSSPELYGDAVSVLFNDPVLLHENAPTFYKEFFNFLDEKPEVRKQYFELQDLLYEGEEKVFAKRREAIREGYQKAEDMQKATLLEKLKTKVNIFHALDVLFNDKNAPINRKVKEAIKKGATIEDSVNPQFEMAGLQYTEGKLKNFILDNFQPAYAKANEVTAGWDTLGEILQMERAIFERGEMANPGGFDKNTAQSYLDNLKKEIGEADWNKLQQAKQVLRDGVQATVQLIEDNEFKSKELIDQMKANPAYATFQVIDHITENLTSAVRQQVGTLKDIANPATSTIMKSIVTMRAIDYNNAKKTAISFQKEHFAGEIEPAKTYFDGKRNQFIEPKDKEKGLVLVIEEGKIAGYYMPKDTAYVLNGTTDKNLMLAAKVSRMLTGTSFYRPLFTTMNLGFQSFNFARDAWRFWRSFPHKTFGEVLMSPVTDTIRLARGYSKAILPSARRAMDKRDPIINEMENSKILGLTYNDIIVGEGNEDKEIERVLQRSNVLNKKKKRGIFTPIFKVLEGVQVIGDFIETLPKVAGYVELKNEMPKEALADFIRTRVGSPNFRTTGALTPITNNILMFSNAFKEGYKTDFKTATEPGTRSSWWWKILLTTLLPGMYMFAQQAGQFGERRKKEMEGVSEYDKTNYQIVTLGFDKNGKTIYLRLPQDETARLVRGLQWKIMHFADKDQQDKLTSLFDVIDFGGGQIPNYTPSWTAAGATLQYLSGKNPYDSFRNRNIIPDTEFEAGYKRSFPIFMDWLAKQQGAGIVVPSFKPQGEQTDLQKFLNLPVLSNLTGRWLKVSDYGQAEMNKKIVDQQKQETAEQTLVTRERVDKYVKKWQDSSKSQEVKNTLVKEFMKESVEGVRENRNQKLTLARKKIRLALALGEYGVNTDSLIKTTSNDAKVEILKRVREDMNDEEFRNYTRTIRREGIISDAVLTKLRRAK